MDQAAPTSASAEHTVTVEDPLIPGAAAPAPPRPWPHLTRVLFRIAFLYFLLFAFCDGNGTIFDNFWKPGQWIATALTWPLDHLADWVSTRVLHFSGVGATHHPTGSGDTLIQWVEQGLFVLLAVAGGLAWTAIAAVRGNRRIEYTTAHAWLRFLLRLTCGMFLLTYGLVKLFPMQMPPISTGVLNEPVGNLSPMTMLWSLIALNPLYEVICGAAEVIGGVLLLFRRTALAGALLGAFVMTNVLLYNMFFDVPVKLFAANLLLALLFITLPDLPALFRFFWLHQPAAPTGVWVPPASRRGFRIATRTIEVVFVASFLLLMPYQFAKDWMQYRANNAKSLPMRGGWHIDVPTGAFADPEKQPVTDVYLDTPTLVRARSAGGELWRTGLMMDDKAHTCNVSIYTSGSRATFAWIMPDNDHLVWTAVKPKDATAEQAKTFQPYTLHLTRIAQPSHYPLLERGFHWVNEWGLER